MFIKIVKNLYNNKIINKKKILTNIQFKIFDFFFIIIIVIIIKFIFDFIKFHFYFHLIYYLKYINNILLYCLY